ncbi:hypothetical protein [Thermopolyspora flexuosa]|nr:hypothetical protein [Thermopolyspora flexuosa]
MARRRRPAPGDHRRGTAVEQDPHRAFVAAGAAAWLAASPEVRRRVLGM